jgi:hypothetical protein
MESIECPACLGTAKRMPVLSYINRTDDFYLCETVQPGLDGAQGRERRAGAVERRAAARTDSTDRRVAKALAEAGQVERRTRESAA